jgi:hypothetical protein
MKKKCFKGNLHCHSTFSDGALTPEEIVKRYKEKGYNFIAFSEHDLFTGWKNFNDDNFIILPAIERAVDVPNSYKCYHIHGIQGSKHYVESSKETPLKHGMKIDRPHLDGLHTVQKVIDELKDTGNIVILNHPLWSSNTFEELSSLEGYFALEVFNYGCEVENKTGLSTMYWNHLLQNGKNIFGVATDDNHNFNRYSEAAPEWDSFGGWINVYAEALTQDAICDALLKGEFYSSSGPEIFSYSIENGEVFVECSPVERIYFITYPRRGYSRCSDGKSLTSASYKLKGDEQYIRIECQDQYGKTAWTNAIFLK